jgi:hypothetical protein
VRGRSTYVPLLGFQQNKTSCNKIASSPFTSTTYHKIVENYSLHPRNQEHLTLIAEISIQNQQTIHNRSFPSIAHERERPITPKGPKISEVLLHNGEEKMMI